jgi:hypothetical protein
MRRVIKVVFPVPLLAANPIIEGVKRSLMLRC